MISSKTIYCICGKSSDKDTQFSRARTEVADRGDKKSLYQRRSMLLPKVIEVIDFVCTLLKTSKNNYLGLVRGEMRKFGSSLSQTF